MLFKYPGMEITSCGNMKKEVKDQVNRANWVALFQRHELKK